MMGSARQFSTQVDTDDSDMESVIGQESKKGRFFRFLEKAEKLDEKIKHSP